MKRSHAFAFLVPCFVLALVLVGDAANCQEIIPITVKNAAICLDVVDRACVDPNDVFPAQVGRLYCFTRVFGAQEDIEITHVWYFGDIERARVTLHIHSVNFRTWSSKIIQPHEIGNWHVDVLGPGDKLLKTVPFEIVQ